MPELDAIRGFAALSVLFYHGLYWEDHSTAYSGLAKDLIWATKPGWLGVNLFFVLSGFLITGILLNSKNGPKYYANFYIRRGLRIIPAYYAVLVLLLLLREPASFVGISAIYLANMAVFFKIPMAYGPLWSLAVEEHFYLLWPTVIKRCRKLMVAVVSLTILFTCPILRAYWFHLGRIEETSFLTWLVADGLALGALISLVLNSQFGTRQTAQRLASLMLILGGLVYLCGRPFGIESRKTMAGAALQFVPWNFSFGAILIFAMLIGSSRFRRSLQQNQRRGRRIRREA